MRKQYKELLNKYGIPDYLSQLRDLPYSRKIKIVEDLLSIFNPLNTQYILQKYKEEYIEGNRVNLMTISNSLKYLARKYIK